MKIDATRILSKIEPWLGLRLLIAEFFIFLAYVPIKQRGGFANPETYLYIPAHLNLKEKLLGHIFNMRLLDNWGFQNRNLSYLVDYWDVQAMAWFIKMGHPHFLSLFHFIGVGIIVFGLWYILRRILELDKVASFFLCTLLLLTPTLHVTASYSRSSKMGAGIEIIILSLVSLELILNRSRSAFTLALLWLSAFACSFFDMVSVAVCLYFGLVSAVFIFLQEQKFLTRRTRTTLLFFGSIFVLNKLFGRLVPPAIHEYYYGDRYYFAQIPMKGVYEFLHHPIDWLLYVCGMCVDQIRFFAGTFPFAVSLLGVAILFWITFSLLKFKYGTMRAVYGLSVLVLPIMGIWLLLRIGHEPIFHEVFRRLYYPLPFQILIAVGGGVLIKNIVSTYGAKGLRIAKITLGLAFLGSISSLDGHIEVVRNCYIHEYISVSTKVLAGLRTYMQTKNESELKDEVLQNLLYQTLKKHYDERR